MRFLKRLQLQGYKTFASRTEFVFDAGVTAIVGPNGSGKSNVADGLRWVLGEQSFGTLRGKRTEDMIFSGSEQRARLGMAFVSLIFDNSTGWLPIDFSEVEISRRAYRSGENEYCINGNRVRLRDIADLLGNSGLSERTYTVIGQGLVDQALSQRPEERRKLFEEAAGITVHQRKRDQASQKLADAHTNLTRAQDIISELTPRLRYLKGQARRANEFRQLKTDLDAHLQIWYGYKWYQALVALAAARERLTDHTGVTEEGTAALNALLEGIAARRAERARLREELGEWHRTSSQLHRQAETVQRELAVRSEQHRLWGEQREELERELVHLLAMLEDGEERLRTAVAELAQAGAAHEAHRSRVAAAQQDLDARERERQAQVARLNQTQDAVLALKTQLADRRSRLAQSAERRTELLHAQAEQAQAVRTAVAQLADLETQIATLTGQITAADADLARIDQARQTGARNLAAAQEAERKAGEALNMAQRGLARLQDQHDMLARLRDEGAGMSAGPRAVLSAARQETPSNAGKSAGQAPPLEGIIGALGDLIEAPPELERAIEAALGGRLQDIVVRSWEDAEAAVAFLKRNQSGRATFLPLDSLRPGRAANVPRRAGVLGLASELVKFDRTIQPAVDLALNRILVVEDLPTARHLVREDTHATLVTVEGEIVRPGGSVTGGAESNRRDSGVLARARALRALPAQIRAARTQVAEHEAAVAAARQRQEAVRADLAEARVQREKLTVDKGRLTAEQNRLGLAADRARQTRAWHDERRQQVAQELAGLDGRETDLHAAITTLTGQSAGQEAAVADARRDLALLATDDFVSEIARLRAEAAVSAGQLRSYQARVDELTAAQRVRAGEIAAKRARIETLAAQQVEAGRAIGQQGTASQGLTAEITALAAQIDPAEARLAEIERDQRAAEAQERALRDQLRHAQMRQSQAELAMQRAHDELAHLRAEIEKELGLVALDSDEALDDQPPLPLNGMITRLQRVTELPQGLEEDVRNLRHQVNRLGPVNMDAVVEYSEVEARYNFLTSQTTDLEAAAASLEKIIAELDQVMEREFMATFKAVATLFRDEFSHLFGGGSAKLMLTAPDNPSTTGVEISARPPGKREQGLALLSGGERSLTAAALIFSILKARPTPFCVLDEVDAALDEANVGRFREALKALSKQTQFILITHNRGTIEIADTIYGISMGADNTSQTLSLKLEGQEIVPVKIGEPDQAS
ncbi:MAG: chromosome segregation protein SMC [Chloroflexi bacterium HGW-Chloroflexi-1]|nr:MAG: chromosome segregation protein SMC [Chloroflexi bacterium HGW-Chloroflexi-1]